MKTLPRFNTQNIAFVFIDLQTKLLGKIPNAARLVGRNSMLLRSATIMKVPYLVTSQYRKGLGELANAISSGASDVIDKTSFSCLGSPEFSQRLDRLSREWLIISGVETHICVLQTTLDLLRAGRSVAVVSDAVGARGEEDHRRGLDRMESSGALIVTSEMLVYELLGRSDTDVFKKVLPLIKDL